MACPKCGYAENLAEAMFCEQCGESLSPPPVESPAPAISALPATESVAAEDPTPPNPPMQIYDAPTMELLPSRRAPEGWTCVCGAANPADEAYCVTCGEERPAADTGLNAGSRFAGFNLVERVDATSYHVRRGTADDGRVLTLQFGPAERLDTLADTLRALAPATDDAEGVVLPEVVAAGDDPRRGRYLVLGVPDGAWHPLPAGTLGQAEAGAALGQLLHLSGRAAEAGRLLLLSAGRVQSDGTRLLVHDPVALSVPLTAPLLADPAFLPPELREGAAAVQAWPASAYSAAATVHAATGNALGFSPGWHAMMGALFAASPSERPASLEAALDMLQATEPPSPVSAHHVAFLTDIGHHHPVNQDAGGVWSWQRTDGTPITLAIVADGVSAGAHSEDASALAVELFRQTFEQHWSDSDLNADGAERLLIEAGLEAQKQLQKMPFESYDTASASTLVAVCILGGTAAGIWCGDSRAYGVTPSGMRQLTRDHSWVNIMVDSGRMSLEEAKTDRRAHVIARWLGVSDPPREDPGYDRFRYELAPGDRLLVCSDGLYMYFDEPYGDIDELTDILYRNGDGVETAVTEMVTDALDRGGFDNITAVLVALA